MEFPGTHNELPREPPTLTEAMIRKHQSFDNNESISQSLEVNPSPLPVPAQHPTQSKTNEEVFASKFDMKYVQQRYTLKKFISNNDTTYNSDEEVAPAHLATKVPNDGNESVLSENIRVGHDTANPPSLRDDSIDMQSEGSVVFNETQPPYYPATPEAQPVRLDRTIQKERKDPQNRANDKNLTKHVSTSGAGIVNKTHGSIVHTALFNNPRSLDATMMNEFSAKLHQELNPSLTDFEQKVDKLARMAACEPDLSGLHMEEINRKCVEIMSLEDRLDELVSELATLCTDAVEKYAYGLVCKVNCNSNTMYFNCRADLVTAGADKLARYAESKANYYKERVQRARQEIPGIVDECARNVWNPQVRIRLNQMELLMKKLLM